MLTSRCFYCSRKRVIEPTEQPWPFCDDRCEQEFINVVYGLADGVSFEQMDIDPSGELARRALDELRRIGRQHMIWRREFREDEYARSRPRRLRPLYPI